MGLINSTSAMKSFFKSDIAVFISKVLLIYFGWYLIYELWLLPDGTVDRVLSENIASITAGILSFFGEDVFLYHRIVGIVGAAGVEIVDGCNGIAAIGLFLGFILAYPGKWVPRIAFSVFGIIMIYLVNVVRIVTLAFTQLYWPAGFDFTHDYSTTAIFYIFIFILWMIWVNSGEGDSLSRSGKMNEPVPAA